MDTELRCVVTLADEPHFGRGAYAECVAGIAATAAPPDGHHRRPHEHTPTSPSPGGRNPNGWSATRTAPTANWKDGRREPGWT